MPSMPQVYWKVSHWIKIRLSYTYMKRKNGMEIKGRGRYHVMRLLWPQSFCVLYKIPSLTTNGTCLIVQDSRRMQSFHRNLHKTSWKALPNIAQTLSHMFCGNTTACYDVIACLQGYMTTFWYTETCNCTFNILFWILPCSIYSLYKGEIILQTNVFLQYRESTVENKSSNGFHCSMYKCSLLPNFRFGLQMGMGTYTQVVYVSMGVTMWVSWS